MKKILLASMAMCIGTAMMTSCSQDEENLNQSQVQTRATMMLNAELEHMQTRAQSGAINAWAAGDELGIFLTSGKLGNPYLGKAEYDNVKFTYSASTGWSNEEVLLGNEDATVYAYYPWSAQVDPSQVPVELNQTDYLYGTADNTVSFMKRTAKITMHHAMTQFVIYLKRGSYAKTGEITAVTLKNMHSKNAITDGGKLDISTGIITGGAASPLTVNAKPATLGSKSDEDLQFMKIMVPFSAIEQAGDVRLQVSIDDEQFYFDLAQGTSFEAGKRNIYRATINSSSLEIGKDDITIEPWQDEEEKTAELSPLSE